MRNLEVNQLYRNLNFFYLNKTTKNSKIFSLFLSQFCICLKFENMDIKIFKHTRKRKKNAASIPECYRSMEEFMEIGLKLAV